MIHFTALAVRDAVASPLDRSRCAPKSWLRRLAILLIAACCSVGSAATSQASAINIDSLLTVGVAGPLSLVLAEPMLELPTINTVDATPVSSSIDCVTRPAVDCPPLGRIVRCLPRQRDQLWVISTRSLGCSSAVSLAGLRAWHYVDGRWAPATVAEFLASDDPAVPTTFYVHGNRIDHQKAFAVGWSVYTGLARQARTDAPLRFVLWSWPSDRIQGKQVEDVRIKAARTNVGAYQFAWLLDQLNPQVPVTLIGYSFGARIVTGSLHLLGGGAIGQYVLTGRQHPDRSPLNAILQGAALDNDWLIPGRFHGRALSQLDHLLLINNGCDQVLKRYSWIYGQRRNCGPQALGYTGFAGLGMLAPIDRAKVRQIDACCHVGKQHDWALYAGSPALNASMAPYVFAAPVSK